MRWSPIGMDAQSAPVDPYLVASRLTPIRFSPITRHLNFMGAPTASFLASSFSRVRHRERVDFARRSFNRFMLRRRCRTPAVNDSVSRSSIGGTRRESDDVGADLRRRVGPPRSLRRLGRGTSVSIRIRLRRRCTGRVRTETSIRRPWPRRSDGSSNSTRIDSMSPSERFDASVRMRRSRGSILIADRNTAIASRPDGI
jgi:hypothetical protein